MAAVSRRQFLGISGASLVLAGCTEHPEPAPTRSSVLAPTGRPTASPTPAPVGPPEWRTLSRRLGGALFLPGQSGYDAARLVQNPRYDSAAPLAVLAAASASDVAAAIAFARSYRIPLSMRSGGHSYPGWSSGGGDGTGTPASLVLDVRKLDRVTVHSDGTVRIGAGASLAQVYSAVAASGRALAAGSCATVGIAGLTLGGGVGVLSRAYGLTCDALTELEIVTADGELRTATNSRDTDLFWASRGGGGGHLGVVTSLTFQTRPAPSVTTWSLRWPYSSATAVVGAWQDWAPHADNKLWSTLKLLNGKNYAQGPGLFLSGTWIGKPGDLTKALAPLLQRVPAPPSQRSSSTLSYRDAMMGYAGCRNIPLAQCTTAPGGKLTRESFAATSHIASRQLTRSGIADLLAKVETARAVPGIREGGISMDALGGAVAELGAGETAFGHRGALMSVQYTATFEAGSNPAPLDAYVRGFRAAMVPHWGDGAYVNYADSRLVDAATAYFGDNAPRLARIRQKYDPLRMFSQPQAY
jgi:hypothetical protein